MYLSMQLLSHLGKSELILKVRKFQTTGTSLPWRGQGGGGRGEGLYLKWNGPWGKQLFD